MKDRRKIYQDPWPQDWREPEPQGTLMELLLILLIGIIAVLYLGYKYYVQTPPNPVEVQQEGSKSAPKTSFSTQKGVQTDER